MREFTVTRDDQLCSGGRESIPAGDQAYESTAGWVYCWDHLDHEQCSPAAHDFDPEGAPDQARDEHGRRRCNDCGALCFYCTNDDWYHHAPSTADPCFLCKDQGWDVLIPDAIPVPADWPGNECNRI